MKDWIINENGTVTLRYEDGDVVVNKKDFDRAFGTMINSTKQQVEKDFSIK